jgi:hypothetical protein
MKGKSADINFIHRDTKMKLIKCGKTLCIAFDFGGRSMKGIGTEDWHVASALSNYFGQMAKALKKKPSKPTAED